MVTKRKSGTNSKGRTQDQNYELITNEIIQAIEYAIENNKLTPWDSPNTPVKGGLFPHNAESLRAYTGFNVFILRMKQAINSYPTSQWLTFQQIQKYGGDVKGQQSTPIAYWDFKRHEDKDENGEVIATRVWANLYIHRLFNVAQVTGLKLPEAKELQKLTEFDPIAEAEKIIKNFKNKPKIFHDTADDRYFQPSTDEIHLPPRKAFKSAHRYYKTVFHELTHSTGHKSRLNRWENDDMKAKHFGDEAYSKEELVAEFGASFLCMESGIDSTEVRKNSIAYLRGWLRALKNDKKLALQAASKAQKAADYILGRKTEDVKPSAKTKTATK